MISSRYDYGCVSRRNLTTLSSLASIEIQKMDARPVKNFSYERKFMLLQYAA